MAHHGRQKGIWVIFWRKASGQPDMDYDEAVAAAAKNFGVGKNQIKAGYPTLNPVTNTKQPQNFSYEKDGVRLVVHFEPRVPVQVGGGLAPFGNACC